MPRTHKYPVDGFRYNSHFRGLKGGKMGEICHEK